jgi:hypothetical protein
MWVQEFDGKVKVTCRDPRDPAKESYVTLKKSRGFADSALSLTIVDALIGAAGYAVVTLVGD